MSISIPPPTVLISYTIHPPSTLDPNLYPSIPSTQTHSIPLIPNLSSKENPPHRLTTRPVNKEEKHDSFYTALLIALSNNPNAGHTTVTSASDSKSTSTSSTNSGPNSNFPQGAQSYLNSCLTQWKDSLTTLEKHREIVGEVDKMGHKKRGEGRGMMMVKAAKEDGEDRLEEKETGIMGKGGVNEGHLEAEEDEDDDEEDGAEDGLEED